MRATIKNIFREYNIPSCNEPKKRKKLHSKPRASKARISTTTNFSPDDDTIIENFSDDENLAPPRYPYIQLRRSFEIPLKIVPVRSHRFNETKTACNENIGEAQGRKKLPFGKETSQVVGNTLTPPEEEESDDDCMPRPIKEEILSQPSEDLQLSMPCSTNSTIMSSIASIAPRLRTKESSDESSVSSGDHIEEHTTCRRTQSLVSLNESLGRQPHIRSRKEMATRYRPLNISITKMNSSLSSPTKKVSQRTRKTRSAGKTKKSSQTSNNDPNLSRSLSDEEEPFQTSSADKSFVCSSPKPSQIINTPNSTPSPRKRPTELDLMIELIERENSMRNTSVIRRSPRKCSKQKPGGYAELYQRSLGKAKTDARFLKHDKKFGLKNGVVLRILQVESSHGVHVAQVQSDDHGAGHEGKFVIVLPPQMVNQIKSDSRVEAFFDDVPSPYSLKCKGGAQLLKVFVKPYKLLLL